MSCSDGFNDPPADSLFEVLPPGFRCRCKVCATAVANCTEARDAHLNEVGCHNPTRPGDSR